MVSLGDLPSLKPLAPDDPVSFAQIQVLNHLRSGGSSVPAVHVSRSSSLTLVEISAFNTTSGKVPTSSSLLAPFEELQIQK